MLLGQSHGGIEADELWDSLCRTRDLMHKASIEVGEQLGYKYPVSIEQKAFAYIEEIRQMER